MKVQERQENTESLRLLARDTLLQASHDGYFLPFSGEVKEKRQQDEEMDVKSLRKLASEGLDQLL